MCKKDSVLGTKQMEVDLQCLIICKHNHLSPWRIVCEQGLLYFWTLTMLFWFCSRGEWVWAQSSYVNVYLIIIFQPLQKPWSRGKQVDAPEYIILTGMYKIRLHRWSEIKKVNFFTKRFCMGMRSVLLGWTMKWLNKLGICVGFLLMIENTKYTFWSCRDVKRGDNVKSSSVTERVNIWFIHSLHKEKRLSG